MTISRQWLHFGAVAAVALVALNIGLTLNNAKRLRDDARLEAQTREVRTELASLLSLVTDAETGQRGYLITGEELYLTPYNDAVQLITEQIATIDRLTAENPQQKSRTALLRAHVSAELDELDRTIDARRDQGFEAARELVLTDVGKKEMDSIREIVEQMQYDADRLLGERTRDTDTTFWTTLFTGMGSGFAALAAIMAFMHLSNRYAETREQINKEISDRNELLKTTLVSIGDAVITTDSKSSVTNMNPTAEALTGWSHDEAIGKPLERVFRIFHETTREPAENPASRALQVGNTINMTNNTMVVSRDGTERPIDDSAAPIRNGDGTIVGCVLVFRDVTKRRQQERQVRQSERTFRTTFDRAPIGVSLVDHEGYFRQSNAKLCLILGYTAEQLGDLTYPQITHDEDLPSLRRNIEKLRSGEAASFTMECRLLSISGEPIWVNLTVALVRDQPGQPDFYIAMVEDIREWIAAEKMRAQMAAIIASSNDAIIGKSFEGIVTSWNPAAEHLFGFSEDEMVGQSILKIVPANKQDEEMSILEKLKLGEDIQQYKTVRLRNDGTTIDVMLNLSPINDSSGAQVGVSTIARDITEQERVAASLRESESRFQTLADNMSQFAWMADVNGWIYWYNKRWYDYTGTTLDEMQGWGWMKVHHPDHIDRVVKSVQHAWDTGEPWEDTFPLRGKDGNYRWFLSRAVPIYDDHGDFVAWFGSNTDITALKEYEESLQQARIAAEQANSSRGEFLANMSHEIRTPMTAILGHADILADHLKDPDNIQCVDTIRRNGKFLLEIINDILDLSKIDAGKFKVDQQRVQPDEILAEVRSLMDVRAHEKELEFDVRINGRLPQSIETDAIRLRQVLLNLVSNAIKFTDRGRVELTARFLASSNQMQFSVTDTGIGISDEDLARLFKPFVQADSSSTRAYEGTGLGLAISRRLARALGGDIAVESKLGQGSTFSLTIACGSLANVEIVETSLTTRKTDVSANAVERIDGCILVVDDRRDIRFLAQHFIEKAGGKVMIATNGREAIDILTHPKGQEIDLVLMDMQMPIMDGYTATKELRSLGFTKPIIALTANAMKEDREQCLAVGCDDYTTKPLNGPLVLSMIAKLV